MVVVWVDGALAIAKYQDILGLCYYSYVLCYA